MAAAKTRDESFFRAIVLQLCKDGTISYRTRGEPVFNGAALPVFTVDTIEQAQQFQVRFGRLQHGPHPQIPDKRWYRLSRRPWKDGEVAIPEEGLDYADLELTTAMFRAHWMAHFAARVPTLAEWRARVSVDECRFDGTKLPERVDYYPHGGGWPVADATLEGADMDPGQRAVMREEGWDPKKWWLSLRCPKCQYDWSLCKLGALRP